MVCKDCEEYDEKGYVCYYRWGKANIGIIACKKHAAEIILAMSDYQSK